MSEGAFHSLRVLIVEDQAESRSFLRGVLEDLGIVQVFETDDGRKAMQYMETATSEIDIILCDWNMPTTPGIDFLRSLRAAGLNTPFLMISGRGDQNSVVEVRKLGSAAYIRKPFSPLQVESKLRILIQQRFAV